jgi:hypothetical protein
MRPIRTLAPLALGLVVLAVAGCQRPGDPTTTAAPTPTQIEQAAPTTTPARHAAPPSRPTDPAPTPDPTSETIVGLWPVKTLAQARELQDSLGRLCPGRTAPVRPLCGASGAGCLPGPLPPRRVGGHPVPGPAGASRQWCVGRDPGRGASGLAPTARAPDRNLVLSAARLALLGQRRGQRSTLLYLRLP